MFGELSLEEGMVWNISEIPSEPFHIVLDFTAACLFHVRDCLVKALLKTNGYGPFWFHRFPLKSKIVFYYCVEELCPKELVLQSGVPRKHCNSITS